MDNHYTVEFISENLDFKYKCKFFSLPSIGKKIWIDDNQYEISDVQLYFYTCNKKNKVRVYIKNIKED